MTPLHLEILINYYTRRTDFEMVIENKVRRDYAYELAKKGLLYTEPPTENNNIFSITDYGRETLERILNFWASEYKPKEEI